VVSNGELVVFDHDWRHWWSGAKLLICRLYSCGAPRKVCSLSPYAQRLMVAVISLPEPQDDQWIPEEPRAAWGGARRRAIEAPTRRGGRLVGRV